jgi:hypothetical protein
MAHFYSNWNLMNPKAVHALNQLSLQPGEYSTFDTSNLPFSGMKGLVSACVSSYSSTRQASPDVTVGAEVCAFRTERQTTKAYNYAIGTSSNDDLVSNGPYKKDIHHHSFTNSPPVPPEDFFREPNFLNP